MPNSMLETTEELKAEAAQQGFALSGVTASAMPGRLAQFHQWLDSGYAGTMEYLPNRRNAYRNPSSILDGCRTIVMLAMPYANHHTIPSTTATATGYGRVARYAAGSLDYHDDIHRRLKHLRSWMLERHPSCSTRGVVDTAPLLEREFAELAGLGWVGKNTLLLNRQLGSYFFLAALLTDLPLVLDPVNEKGYCGSCTACLDACPTDAFAEPYILDATRCISYLTIEHRGEVCDELASKLGEWTFGCDICQQVCPWNHKPQHEIESCYQPDQSNAAQLNLNDILRISEEQFRERFRKTPFWRSRRRGMIRNALLCVGNTKLKSANEPACQLLHNDPDPIIRSAAAWAIAQIGATGWREILERVAKTDDSPAVSHVITGCLSQSKD